MTPAPEISLLVCTRDRATSLSPLLASITAAAGAADIEVVVVDNGSTDETPRLLERWAAEQAFPVRLLAEPRPGLARARNAGLAHVRGHIVAMTDDDCRLHPGYFTGLIAAFADAGGPAIIGGRILLGDDADLPVTVKLEDHPMIAAPGDFPGGFVMGANLAVSAGVLRDVGRFDERFGAGAPFIAAEDTDYLFRATRRGIPLLYDPRFVVDHHHGRRCRTEERRLLAGYGFGDGALYAKHLLRDRRVLDAIRRDFADLRRDVTDPVTIHAGIGRFYLFRLRQKLRGFLFYWGYRLARGQKAVRAPSRPG